MKRKASEQLRPNWASAERSWSSGKPRWNAAVEVSQGPPPSAVKGYDPDPKEAVWEWEKSTEPAAGKTTSARKITSCTQHVCFSGRRPKVVDAFCTSMTEVSKVSNNKHMTIPFPRTERVLRSDLFSIAPLPHAHLCLKLRRHAKLGCGMTVLGVKTDLF